MLLFVCFAPFLVPYAYKQSFPVEDSFETDIEAIRLCFMNSDSPLRLVLKTPLGDVYMFWRSHN